MKERVKTHKVNWNREERGRGNSMTKHPVAAESIAFLIACLLGASERGGASCEMRQGDGCKTERSSLSSSKWQVTERQISA